MNLIKLIRPTLINEFQKAILLLHVMWKIRLLVLKVHRLFLVHKKVQRLEMIELLDVNLTKFANVVEKLTGISLHEKKGAGAAGGAGGAFQAFFPGEIKQGISVVLNAISFDEHLKDADLILTGEGKTDVQTLSGKTPFGIAKVAQREGKPIILISGVIDEKSRECLSSLFH